MYSDVSSYLFENEFVVSALIHQLQFIHLWRWFGWLEYLFYVSKMNMI